MAEIARLSGLAREGLYKALRADSLPRMETLTRVLGALGIRLKAEVIPTNERKVPPLTYKTEEAHVATKPAKPKPLTAKPAAKKGGAKPAAVKTNVKASGRKNIATRT